MAKHDPVLKMQQLER